MPYKMRKQSGKYCVLNSETGDNKGCSSSRAKAIKHMRALYWAEGSEKKEIDSLVDVAIADFNSEYPDEAVLEKSMYYDGYEIPSAVNTFAMSYSELEALESAHEAQEEISELIDQFPYLAQNIMMNPEITDKASAIGNLATELSGLIGGVSTEDSEDKEKGKVEELIVENCAECEEKKSPIERAISYVKSKLGLPDDSRNEPIMVWKEANGEWRWIARYSNSFRDRDNPPEIISTKSHRHFVELVEKNLVPMPDLWLWHVPEWKIGEADHVVFDEISNDAGFAIAAGHFSKGMDQVAEWISTKEDVLVSHGMPVTSIKRNEQDPSIIDEHITREISPLPAWNAANELTGFVALKELDMTIPADKRKKLIEDWKMPEDMIASIEAANQADAEKATSEGIQTKETDSAPLENKEGVEDTQPVVESTEVSEVSQSSLTREEVAEALSAVIGMVSDLATKIDAMGAEIKEMNKTRQEDVVQTVKSTPQASLIALITGSAVGSDEARVPKTSGLTKNKPAETKTNGRTGIPFLDQMLEDGK